MGFTANSPNHNVLEIVSKIREYENAKKVVKNIRVEILGIAVDLGLDQDKASQLDCVAFLDGYLVALGCIQPYRLED